MTTDFRKTLSGVSFEEVVDTLTKNLKGEGFVICGSHVLRKNYWEFNKEEVIKYRILITDLPKISSQMLSMGTIDGTLLPCSISIIEAVTGEIIIIPINPTEIIAQMNQDNRLQSLAMQISKALQSAINSLDRNMNKTPDMVTSWE